jgi:hypothetical protein
MVQLSGKPLWTGIIVKHHLEQQFSWRLADGTVVVAVVVGGSGRTYCKQPRVKDLGLFSTLNNHGSA